ncbi:unnamed protein product [Oppiella nova]|uniref:Uncharacterized protein n=1 Tax=Oppiella nova TaxID=334625 RepID=A0A7R9MIP8_9ACAR|nr:unnamed protein product [Oppiella nova]CAG2177843.1 unnamed protein product [Oppiella nova]
MVLITILSESTSDKTCDEIRIDAITTVNNQTLVVFDHNKNVWVVNRGNGGSVRGPCPVRSLFNEMNGPVKAAVTIIDHPSIVEFIGAAVYFESKQFYTFRNFNPYVVEWGSLKYIPHKGLVENIATSSAEAQKILKGIEFDTPVISNMDLELKKFGIPKTQRPKHIDAALTLRTSGQNTELYLFVEDKYCSFRMQLDVPQECLFKPIKEFLNCNKVVTKGVTCDKPSGEEKAINVALNKAPKDFQIGRIASRSGDLSPKEQNDDNQTKLCLYLQVTCDPFGGKP